MLVFSMLLVGASAGVPVTLSTIDEINIKGRELRLADIVDLSKLPISDRVALGPKVVATLASDRNSTKVSSAVLESWARRQFPAMRFQPAPSRTFTITYSTGENSTGENALRQQISIAGCSELASPSDQGDILLRINTQSTDCDPKRERAALFFDRKDQVVRAAENLSTGAYLGRVILPEDRVTDRGTPMVFVTFDGPVRVERNVRALQAAKSGKKFFVAAGDGSVFATHYQPAVDTGQ